MKRSKVIGIVKRHKDLCIAEQKVSEDYYVQWMGDRGCLWCMEGTPKLGSVAEFFTQNDIGEKAQAGFRTCFGGMPPHIDARNTVEGEHSAQLLRSKIEYMGATLRCIRYSGKGQVRYLIFDDDYLSPVRDGSQYITFTVRESAYCPYICVKDGLMLVGVILPYAFDQSILSELLGDLEEFVAGFRAEMHGQQGTEDEP